MVRLIKTKVSLLGWGWGAKRGTGWQIGLIALYKKVEAITLRNLKYL